MRTLFFFLLCLSLAATAAHAQALRIDSTRFYCNNNATTFDEITDIIQTKDKGFFFTGKAAKPGGGILPSCPGTGANPVMGKLDSLGNIEWIKNFCDTSNWSTTACQTADGGYAINGTNNPRGMSICRYDAIGNFLWKKSYGVQGDAVVNQIITTSDQGFLMLGYATHRDSDVTVTYDYPPAMFPTNDWVLLKLDSLGNKQWVRTLGTSDDDGTSAVLVCDNSNNYYLIGATESKDHDCADVIGHPGWAIYTIKLDSAGNVLWSKARGAGFISQAIYDERDNSILITGRTPSGGHEMAGRPRFGMNDIFLMKLDTVGNYKWGNLFGTPNDELDGATICKAPNGGYFIASNGIPGVGPALYHGLLISADSNGRLLQQREIIGQGGFFAQFIFPFRNSYCLFGASADMQLPEGVGQNCPANISWGSRTMTFSKLSIVPLSLHESPTPQSAFTLSPNPTRNSVEVRFEGQHSKGTLSITNAEGKQINRQHISANESAVAVNTAAWVPGIYLVCFQPEGKPAQCQKLIVQ